ncbi:hypothetical protein [Flavisphingomonas formosensis]|uniref:hypothetical protein n=1 Tax=Flavisphingomonas formosensis TaxID=861534 RepID=UPI0012F8455E|nr:hypothetical protein [Sphingomonas formosensis]
MSHRLRSLLLLPSTLLLLGGCTLSSKYPSLAPRPIEQVGFDTPPPPRPVPARETDSALEAQVADLIGEARRGDRLFQDALPSTREAVSRAGGAGSDPWLDAQQRLTALESLRNPVTASLDQLNTLLSEKQKLDTPPDTDSLEAAIVEAGKLDAAEQAEVQRLAGMLPQP